MKAAKVVKTIQIPLDVWRKSYIIKVQLSYLIIEAAGTKECEATAAELTAGGCLSEKRVYLFCIISDAEFDEKVEISSKPLTVKSFPDTIKVLTGRNDPT